MDFDIIIISLKGALASCLSIEKFQIQIDEQSSIHIYIFYVTSNENA